MPSKNTVRQYQAPAFYHVYNRGACNQKIFLESSDKHKFLSLFKRHLCRPDKTEPAPSIIYIYPIYDIEVVAYCLMNNHFHLLLYQEADNEAITKLLRSISTAYTMYFNQKYKRHGHLYQGVFMASIIQDESYLMHISRYIHMNPRTYMTYKWSSIGAYLTGKSDPWLHPERIMTMTSAEYVAFLQDYESKRTEIKRLKNELEL
jgi:putative transposase